MYTGSLETFSNREDWVKQIRLTTTDNEDIDLTGCTVVLALTDPDSRSQRLSASTDDGGVSILAYDTGVFSVIQWSFTNGKTRSLCAGSYDVGITISNVGKTVQLFAGTVAVIDGIVP